MLKQKELKDMYKNAITDQQRLELTTALLLYKILSEVKNSDKVRNDNSGGEET